MDFAQKNDFVVANASEKYFDKDKELFIKTFSTSKLIPALHKANQYNKRELDARMLLELLKYKTIEEVQQNRGVEVKAEEQAVETIEAKAEEAEEQAVEIPKAKAKAAPKKKVEETEEEYKKKEVQE